jgi:hypothetical protein
VLRRWGNGAKKLIVNLSLMADLPTYSPLAPPGAQRLLRRWFPAAFQAGILGSGDANEPRWLADPTARDAVQRVLGYVHRSLFDVVEALVDHQVLVVAAAGNDGNLGGLHPNPRFPAAYDSVLGVAALARRDAPASPPLLARYTNLGDEAVPIPIQTGVSVFPNGVAVWGGNSVLTRVCADNDDASRIDLAVRPVDAVRGIFSSPVVPITGALNRTGWVYWVGTSFATPVITAIAADTWAALPDLSAADVANAIRTTFSSGTIETTYPGAGPGPLSFPFIDAFQ